MYNEVYLLGVLRPTRIFFFRDGIITGERLFCPIFAFYAYSWKCFQNTEISNFFFRQFYLVIAISFIINFLFNFREKWLDSTSFYLLHLHVYGWMLSHSLSLYVGNCVINMYAIEVLIYLNSIRYICFYGFFFVLTLFHCFFFQFFFLTSGRYM